MKKLTYIYENDLKSLISESYKTLLTEVNSGEARYFIFKELTGLDIPKKGYEYPQDFLDDFSAIADHNFRGRLIKYFPCFARIIFGELKYTTSDFDQDKCDDVYKAVKILSEDPVDKLSWREIRDKFHDYESLMNYTPNGGESTIYNMLHGEAYTAKDGNDEKNVESTKGYHIEYIKNFGMCNSFGRYSGEDGVGALCFSTGTSMWNSFTGNGSRSCYIAYKDGWDDPGQFPCFHGNNTPYDDYGLSMVFIFVNQNQEMTNSNLRWNHKGECGQGYIYGSTDNAFGHGEEGKQRVCKFLGISDFDSVFKWRENTGYADSRNTKRRGPKHYLINYYLSQGHDFTEFGNLRATSDYVNPYHSVKYGDKYAILDKEANRIVENRWFEGIELYGGSILFCCYNNSIGKIDEVFNAEDHKFYDADEYIKKIGPYKKDGSYARTPLFQGKLLELVYRFENCFYLYNVSKEKIISDDKYSSYSSVLRDSKRFVALGRERSTEVIYDIDDDKFIDFSYLFDNGFIKYDESLSNLHLNMSVISGGKYYKIFLRDSYNSGFIIISKDNRKVFKTQYGEVLYGFNEENGLTVIRQAIPGYENDIETYVNAFDKNMIPVLKDNDGNVSTEFKSIFVNGNIIYAGRETEDNNLIYSIYNRRGKLVSNLKLDGINKCTDNGYTIARMTKNNGRKEILIDRYGGVVRNTIYDVISIIKDTHYNDVKNIFMVVDNGRKRRFNIIDVKGNILLDDWVNSIENNSYHNGSVIIKGRDGFLHRKRINGQKYNVSDMGTAKLSKVLKEELFGKNKRFRLVAHNGFENIYDRKNKRLVTEYWCNEITKLYNKDIIMFKHQDNWNDTCTINFMNMNGVMFFNRPFKFDMKNNKFIICGNKIIYFDRREVHYVGDYATVNTVNRKGKICDSIPMGYPSISRFGDYIITHTYEYVDDGEQRYHFQTLYSAKDISTPIIKTKGDIYEDYIRNLFVVIDSGSPKFNVFNAKENRYLFNEKLTIRHGRKFDYYNEDDVTDDTPQRYRNSPDSAICVQKDFNGKTKYNYYRKGKLILKKWCDYADYFDRHGIVKYGDSIYYADKNGNLTEYNNYY